MVIFFFYKSQRETSRSFFHTSRLKSLEIISTWKFISKTLKKRTLSCKCNFFNVRFISRCITFIDFIQLSIVVFVFIFYLYSFKLKQLAKIRFECKISSLIVKKCWVKILYLSIAYLNTVQGQMWRLKVQEDYLAPIFQVEGNLLVWVEIGLWNPVFNLISNPGLWYW